MSSVLTTLQQPCRILQFRFVCGLCKLLQIHCEADVLVIKSATLTRRDSRDIYCYSVSKMYPKKDTF